jgi:hypothetical protein
MKGMPFTDKQIQCVDGEVVFDNWDPGRVNLNQQRRSGSDHEFLSKDFLQNCRCHAQNAGAISKGTLSRDEPR